MASILDVYDHVSELLMKGVLDLTAGTFRAALVSSSYTFDASHTSFADCSAYEIAGTGYSAGGATLSGLSVTRSGATAKWDAADVQWTSGTFSCRRLVLYKNGTFGGIDNPLLLSVLFDSTPADVTVSGTDLQTIWNANGILSLGG